MGSASKTAFIVDSVCSLPKSLMQKYTVTELPISYSVDEERFVDPMDTEEVLAIFESGVFKRKHEVNTSPPTPQEYEQAIIKKIKSGYVQLVIQTVSKGQSQSYENANAGVAQVRKKLDGRNISIVVIDSGTILSGQGLILTESVARLLKGKTIEQLQGTLKKLSQHMCTYIIPKDPLVAMERSPTRNENNISWLKTLFANTLKIHPVIAMQKDSMDIKTKAFGFNKAAEKLFRHTCDCIDVGLMSPIVVVSYVGPVEGLREMPGYDELQRACKIAKVMLIPTTTSIAGGIYTSVGSLTVSFVSVDHAWTD